MVFGIFLVLAVAPGAAAAGPPAPSAQPRVRLSQADFDEAAIQDRVVQQYEAAEKSAGDDNVVDPAEIIRNVKQVEEGSFEAKATKRFANPAKQTPEPTPIYTESVPVRLEPADSATARSMLNPAPEKTVDPVEAAEIAGIVDNYLITPRLRGPRVDRGSENTITSKARWTFKRSGGGSCAQPGSPALMARKIEALKEVLNRFTGNDDFYDSQCSQKCADPKQTSVLAGLEISRSKITDFDIDQKGIDCVYRIQRKAGTAWQTLQRSTSTCLCR